MAYEISNALADFMNKIHLIGSEKETASKEQIEQLVKQKPVKLMYFNDVSSYTTKIKNALTGTPAK